MRIRSMEEKDLPQIMAIERACFPTPWAQQSYKNELRANDYARYFCLEKDSEEKNSEIIGYMGLWFILEEGHITNIAIHPKYQGQGLGEVLIRAVISLMVREGMERITLEVRASNWVARNLYEKVGFVNVGVRKGYYTDNSEDAIIMWLELTGG
ncbi:MAG: ribosomal protein S18-alanine N-acetyltransferase [Desulfitobacterium sp.]|nr:ribosomal protein S18-alanine N-acetyltransferase [Desulfitobacterium sp.]